MRNLYVVWAAMLSFVPATSLAAQDLLTGGGPVQLDQALHTEYDGIDVGLTIHNAIAELGLAPQASAAASSFTRDTAVGLGFPLRPSAASSDAQMHATVNFVDLASVGGLVRDSECGSRSYDGHNGIDYLAAPFWWDRMDDGDVEVVASASGTILIKIDGEFDRQCTANSSQDNLVAVLHDDGLAAVYRHLRSGSLTALAVGDRINAGDYIGIVGSSGSSTAPHLHFETRIYNAENPENSVLVDPNAGPCGASESIWRHQPAYFDPAILSVRTHHLPPVVGSFAAACTAEQPNMADHFVPGQTAYWAIYLRSQRPGESVRLQVFRPDGSLFESWTLGTTLTTFQPYSYWYAGAPIPADASLGLWRVRAEFGADSIERIFRVGSEEVATNVRIRSAVLPASRSVRSGTAATAYTSVINAGSTEAVGCSIRTAEPFAGMFTYTETDAATNDIAGTPHALFNIAAGQSRSFVIAATPDAGATAKSLDLTLRFDCEFADAAPIMLGVNTLRLSFEDSDQPDVIVVSATAGQNGVLSLGGPNRAAAFAVASSNVGASGNLIVQPQMAGADRENVSLSICETDPATGQCLAERASRVERIFASAEEATFSVFARSTSAIAFDPASNRIFVEVVDAAGVSRGSTSVAVRTE